MTESHSLENDDGTLAAPQCCGAPMNRVGHNSPTSHHLFQCGICERNQPVSLWHGETSQ